MATEQVRYTNEPSGLERLEQFLRVLPAAAGTIGAVFLVIVGVITFLISSVIGDFWQALRVGIMVSFILLIGLVVVLIYIRQEMKHRQDMKDNNIALANAFGSAVSESMRHLPIEGKYRQVADQGPAQPQLPAPAEPARTWRFDGTEQPRDLPATVLNAEGKDVRVDLLDALITIGFGPNTVTNLRDSLRETFPNLHFRSSSMTMALGWLMEQGAIEEDGSWLVDEGEARGMVAEARASRRLPSPTQR